MVYIKRKGRGWRRWLRMRTSKSCLIRLQTLQLLTSTVTSGHMFYSPTSGLTVTGVRLVSVLQCCCIQLLPATAHSSTLKTEKLRIRINRRAGTHTHTAGMDFWESMFMRTAVIYLPLPFASSFWRVFLIVFIIQVVQEVIWLKDSLWWGNGAMRKGGK